MFHYLGLGQFLSWQPKINTKALQMVTSPPLVVVIDVVVVVVMDACVVEVLLQESTSPMTMFK